jgi:hypothetical protein
VVVNLDCFQDLSIHDCNHLDTINIKRGVFESGSGGVSKEKEEEDMGLVKRGDGKSILSIYLGNLFAFKTLSVNLMENEDGEDSTSDMEQPLLNVLIHNSRIINNITINAKNLESLDVFPGSSVKSVILKNINPTVVRSVRIDRCSLLTDQALRGFVVVPKVNALVDANLPKRDSLLYLTGLSRIQNPIKDFSPYFFTSIDLSLSFKLSDAFVENLLGVALALRHLTLDSCNSLECPLIRSSTLETLRMAHCTRLLGLRFADDVPSVLQSVDLRQCVVLGLSSPTVTIKRFTKVPAEVGSPTLSSSSNLPFSPFPLTVTRY